MIVISCDLVGFQYKYAKLVRNKISHKTGVPIKNIMLHFTHSHTSPDMIGVFPGKISEMPRTDVQFPVLRYMMRKISDTGIQSFKEAKIPAAIGFGFTAQPVPPIAGQRRPPYRDLKQPVRVIKITNAETDELLSVLINYQGHPTQLPQVNSDISTEYPGQVATTLYKALPNLQFAAYFNGAIGDVSIRGFKGYWGHKVRSFMKKENVEWAGIRGDKKMWKKYRKTIRNKNDELHREAMEYSFNHIVELGQRFTNLVLPIIEDIPTKPITQLIVSRRFVFPEINRSKPIRPRLKLYKSLHGKLRMLFHEFKSHLRINAMLYGYKFFNWREFPMLNLRKNGRTTLHQTELQVFKINDIVWLACPGEPFLMYSDILLGQIPGRKGFFSSMANDTCGYIFPWSFHVRGGYEESFSFDFLFGQYILKLFTAELKKILAE